ncbi:metallophosphoesterase [Parazoarcus communis]|uniref:Metallophosphoesterase n=1 Tax=Parazoarcus communis TaxID=41977 RepID=A0A2U8HAI2_9RHOO|nr:metallophosphoesterase [Parazoarcus communis]AWI81775.1 metallophosphoesterase [Parazoarcus communis]
MAEVAGYDVIGDIHGHADELEALLRKLDYRKQGGTWRHPERTAVFVGDLIDRGPKQLEVVDIVRRMVEEGHAKATMGNHEFNAIAWRTLDEHGSPLREHSKKNEDQHAAFLAAVDGNPELHKDVVDWFLTLPLWLELDGINVIHACWHTGYMDRFADRLAPGNRLTPELMNEAARKPAPGGEETLFNAIEVWLKGLEAPLPVGEKFNDKDGHPRTEVRVRWWDEGATLYPEAAMIEEHIRARLPAVEIPEAARYRYEPQRPVFFGHYWMSGHPSIQSTLAACTDFSVAKQGKLVAYRWNGEQKLSNEGFHYVQDGRT